MSSRGLHIDQRRIRLGPRLGKGGEGEVYSLDGDESRAVKLYTVSDLTEREQKVEAMIRSGMAAQAPQVAFPLSIVRDDAGRFAGFVMENVLEHQPLHELYSPGSRKMHFPQADYRFLVRTAQNISKAIASAHTIGCVIGDINQSSILVSKGATVALIDSDSFQVTDGDRTFFCRVGVPEYTPPELQGVQLSKIHRTANHDAFGLAIVIFQLLFMGRHPFVGSVRRGEIPTLFESIKAFRFVYSGERDVGMTPPPGTPQLSVFPLEVAAAFEAAFGQASLEARPTAQQWIEILAQLEESLLQCSDQKLHWYPSGATACPWCAMERELGATLFVAVAPPSRPSVHAFDPGADGFSLAAVWKQISAFPQSTVRWLPSLPAATVRPSKNARFARWRSKAHIEGLKRQFFEVEQRWLHALDAWRSRTGVTAVEQLLQQLREAKSAYERLATEEKLRLQAYERGRKDRQLQAFLEKFRINRSNIRGIGPAEAVALASFGVETAADVLESKLVNVPGFATPGATGLLSWRKRLETQFMYDVQENDIDRTEIAKIRAYIEERAASLRRLLLAGRANLDNCANRAYALISNGDPDLARLHEIRLGLRVDLQHLGVDSRILSALAANSTQIANAARAPVNTMMANAAPAAGREARRLRS